MSLRWVENEGMLDSLMLGVSKLNWQLVVVVLGAGLILTAAFGAIGPGTNARQRIPGSGAGRVYPSNETNAGEVLPLPRP